MYTDINTVRSMTGFDISRVGDEMINLRITQAGYILKDQLTQDIKDRSENLSDQEKFELSIGEAELAVSLLCYTLALQATLNKDNKSISANNGGISYRDSVKNHDFLNMAKENWKQAWIQMSKYTNGIVSIAGLDVDPYTNSQFSLTKNYDTTYVAIDLVDQVSIAEYITFMQVA